MFLNYFFYFESETHTSAIGRNFFLVCDDKYFVAIVIITVQVNLTRMEVMELNTINAKVINF